MTGERYGVFIKKGVTSLLTGWQEKERSGERLKLNARRNKKWSSNDSVGTQQWLRVFLLVKGEDGEDCVIIHRPIAVLRAAIMVQRDVQSRGFLQHLRRGDAMVSSLIRARSYNTIQCFALIRISLPAESMHME